MNSEHKQHIKWMARISRLLLNFSMMGQGQPLMHEKHKSNVGIYMQA